MNPPAPSRAGRCSATLRVGRGAGIVLRMRRYFISLLFATIAGCASAPQSPSAPQPPPAPSRPADPNRLIGLSAAELVARLGSVPALQIREGSGTKLQFRTADCVLDAYLYPAPLGGLPRVEYVDTRSPSGADRNEQQCLLDFQRSS